MKKWFMGVMLVALLVTSGSLIYAAPGDFHGGKDKIYVHHGHQEREDARYVLNRTSRVLFAAQRAATHRHRYFGLAQAIAHQRKARELYQDGSYHDAIFHSLRARNLAIQIIQGNGERLEREFARDDREERYAHNAPRDEDLDIKIDKKHEGKDDDAAHIRIEFDIN